MSAEKVLVTGATGFVATHIVDVLLSKGYKVIGTARSEAKYEPLLKEYQAKYPEGDLSFEIVKDMGDPNAFDEVLKKHTDIKYVLHTASPLSFGLNKSLEEAYKIPAVEGTKNILNAIGDYGKQVKNVVITSSHATMVEFDRVIQPVTNENYWSTSLTWDKVGDSEIIAYCCSKKLAEEAAWEFMKTKSPHFALTTVTPPHIFGPQVFDSQVGETLNTSNQVLVNALSIDPKTTEAQKEHSASYVDVRDVAFAHVAPLNSTSINNKRIMPSSGPFCIQSILDSLNKISFLKGKIAVGDPTYCDSEEYQKVMHVSDNTETVKLLGDFKFINLDQSTADIVEQYYRVNNL